MDDPPITEPVDSVCGALEPAEPPLLGYRCTRVQDHTGDVCWAEIDGRIVADWPTSRSQWEETP